MSGLRVIRIAAQLYRGSLCLLIATGVSLTPAAHALTQTITTNYTYNADGAPTAVTTQVDSEAPVTRYFTWDNFVPDVDAPSTGTVSAANGNLLHIGIDPNGPVRFTYDVRDRVVGCGLGDAAATYTYHPASLLAATTVESGDALQFYYDNTRAPRMVNVVQPAGGTTASFLGPVRYLSDGTEQILLKPRKDVAALYDAGAGTTSPYSYDPYGVRSDRADGSGLAAPDSYDLARNPFRFGGEYHDPICDAYYLRARWYLPEHQTFLSRDSGDLLYRYGYTAGNPIGRVDPTGLRFTGMDFSRDIDLMIHRLTPGVSAYIEPVLPIWGQALGGIELVGLLPTFWHHPNALKITELSLIGASVASEVAGEFGWFDRLGTPARALGAHLATDIVLGGTQTTAQSYQHGRLDVPALAQGIEIVASGIFWGRVAGGIATRANSLSAEEIDALYADSAQAQNGLHRSLVFRVRDDSDAAFTSPRMRELDLGHYHEAVLAYVNDSVWLGDAEVTDDVFEITWTREVGDAGRPSRYLDSRASRQTALAGRARLDAVDGLDQDELNGVRAQRGNRSALAHVDNHGSFANNCQRSAARIRDGVASFGRGARGSVQLSD